MADLKALIAARIQKFTACFKANDMKGLFSMYMVDCKIMKTGMDTAHGHEGLAKVVAGFHALGVTTVERKSEEVGPMGSDVMYERGTYTMKTEDGTLADTGKYIVIWKKIGSDWFQYIDIFNTNKA
ncbi:uncharacterized protein [Branchiostoma lanceolatum]|uniref:uncharacterized protein n=1 Tax=Branchiostoma lanceolatum TaxID=7740 RepID=UPI003453DE4D